MGHSASSSTHSSGPASDRPVMSPSYSDIASTKSNRSRSYNEVKPHSRVKDFIGTRSMEGLKTSASSARNEGKKILAKRKENVTKGNLCLFMYMYTYFSCVYYWIFG